MYQFIKKVGYTAALILFAGTAQAAPSYCSSTGGTDGLNLSDMTYGVNGPAGSTVNATDCYGLITNGHLGSSGGNTDTSIINQLWGSTGLTTWGNTNFVELVKKDVGQSGAGNNELGYLWSLDGSLAATSGTWTLTASPLAGLPQYFDFVGVLKGSDRSAAYLFDEAFFDGSGGGSWAINYLNNGNQIPDLSNLTIYGRLGTTQIEDPEDPFQVPEPFSLLLVGTGLLGLAFSRRKRV